MGPPAQGSTGGVELDPIPTRARGPTRRTPMILALIVGSVALRVAREPADLGDVAFIITGPFLISRTGNG